MNFDDNINFDAIGKIFGDRLHKFYEAYWRILHLITFMYPKEPNNIDKERVTIFFVNLANKIPCGKCGIDWKEKMKLFPISNHLNSNKELFYWLCDIHNKITNDQIKKTKKNKIIQSQKYWWNFYNNTNIHNWFLKEFNLDLKYFTNNNFEKINELFPYAEKIFRQQTNYFLS